MILPEKDTIGIYKITSPSGKIYIGQSRCIRSRWISYKSIESIKNQTKLYRSFKKYGFNKHKFEIIHYCLIDELNNLERYYQEFYDCISQNGLNCLLTESDSSPRVVSKETREKISKTLTGVKLSKSTCEKISKSNMGRIVTEETRNKIRVANTGKKVSEETKQKLREINLGKEIPIHVRDKIRKTLTKIIKATSPNGDIYIDGITDLSIKIDAKAYNIRRAIKGCNSVELQGWTFEYIDKDSD